jgi:prepilin-type N-terminal cleavage/methylation domain-containing protein
MNPHPTPLRNRRANAFSLIEVVLALAVSAIGLVAILGLLPQGLQASRDAADNTVSATIVHDIFSTIRAGPFTSVTNAFGFTVQLNGTLGNPWPYPYPNLQIYSLPPPLPGAQAQGAVAYFDQAGITTNSANGQPCGYYKVTLNFQPELAVGAPNGPAAVSMVTATVVWPALAASPINTNVFVTKVAQYNQ